MPLAAFRSNSSRFSGTKGAMQGPVPGDYDVNYLDMGPAAVRAAGGSSRRGSFGGSSSRDMPWQRSMNDVSTGSGSTDAPVTSSFGSSAQVSIPSAAFASNGDRFYNSKQSTPGPGAYSSARTPLSPSSRMNRSASFGSKTQRFGMKGSCGPGPGEFDAKPSAFASASQRSKGASGFGSRSARASPFDVAHKEDTPPAPGAYDTSSGSFTARNANSRSASPSAGFRSGSGRFGRTYDLGQNGADPGAYDPQAYHSMARNANRSFNKASANGASGFGTSLRRQEVVKVAEGPGPAAYDSEGATARGHNKIEARPSSAFASRTKGGEAHIRKSQGPSGGSDFDPHRATGIAASSRRSFNSNVGNGRGLGPRAEREVIRQTRPGQSPGPAAYGSTDPSRPSCERQAASSRGKPSLWAASTSGRDPSSWHERSKPPETPGPGSYDRDDPTRPNAYVKE